MSSLNWERIGGTKRLLPSNYVNYVNTIDLLMEDQRIAVGLVYSTVMSLNL